MTINTLFAEIQIRRHPVLFSIRFHKSSKWYLRDLKCFSDKLGGAEFPISKYPCLFEKHTEAGLSHSVYFIQDLYVAQKVYNNNPNKHVDVGSRIDGFVAHLATFREVELLDIRDLDSGIPNVFFKQADLMDERNIPTEYCDSISSLHALEHFGLGRYGDNIDPEGHLKGFRNITRMLKPYGIFYFSVPIGIQRIEFNAHRVFGLQYLLEMVSADYDIVSFSYIDDSCCLHRDADMTDEGIRTSYHCNCGCAIFELKRKY